MKVRISWKDGIKFEGKHKSGQTYLMDAKAPFGEGKAATPKELLLMGLAGCTGMDVTDILRKSRQEFDKFEVEVDTEETKEHPITFTKIHIKYIFDGSKKPQKEKAQKAVALSMEKYCGVSAMLRKAADITYEIIFN